MATSLISFFSNPKADLQEGGFGGTKPKNINFVINNELRKHA